MTMLAKLLLSFLTAGAALAAACTGPGTSGPPEPVKTTAGETTVAQVPTVTPAARPPVVTSSPEPQPPQPQPSLERHFVESSDCAAIDRTPLPLVELRVSNGVAERKIMVELAAAPATRQQGLMCRSEVPEGAGMLFEFEDARTGGFWMFNTYVPLDIIYLNNGARVGLVRMSPCPRDPGEGDGAWRDRCSAEAREYAATSAYTAALELPAGWLQDAGLVNGGGGELTVTPVNGE